MNDQANAVRRAMSRARFRLPAVVAVVIAGTVIAACGSGSPSNSRSSGGTGTDPVQTQSGSSSTDPSQSQAPQELLNFARCMRSHGVSNFPDPAANGGGFNVSSVGINPSSPAFKAAQTACKQLLPVKRPASGPPSPQAYSRLVHWANCMRAHGISRLPDPRPNPPPSPGSPDANLYGTLMGDGGYWVGIPNSIDAHSPAFTRLATVCGESPDGHRG